MTILDNREQAFEQRFAHDEEMRFRVLSHRNLLFGRWAAGLLGHTGDDAERYIQDVVAALCRPLESVSIADDKIVSDAARDLNGVGWAISPDEVRTILADFEAKAAQDVNSTAHAG